MTRRTLGCFALIALLLVGCRVDPQAVGVNADESAGVGGLPVLGPVPGGSHWHAAYVVRICDRVLEPFEGESDPFGIHTHGDGLVHVHPFVAEAGYERARLGLFTASVGLELSTGEITLPSGGTWRDGDLCDGEPGRVFVDRWEGPSPSSAVDRVFDEPESIRFVADRELYQIAFAPADSPPVVPPSHLQLDLVSAPVPSGEPWVDLDPTAPAASVRIWPVAEVGTAPCEEGQMRERVLWGTPGCFTAESAGLAAAEAITSAQAVLVNRQPGLDLRITPAFEATIAEHFRSEGDRPFVFAIELDGAVVFAAPLPRPPVVPDRLMLAGGFSVESAETMARLLAG